MPVKPPDRSSLKWLLPTAILPVGMMLFFASRVTREATTPTASPSAPSPSHAQTPTPRTAATAVSSATTATVPPLGPPSSSLPREPPDVSSPRLTVETQMKLLAERRDDELRTTFLPGVAISRDQIEACRRRVANAVVRPDWEMAEDGLVNGHRVKRVSMFGKSMTGFHDVGGRWLADAVWCVPVGVP